MSHCGSENYLRGIETRIVGQDLREGCWDHRIVGGDVCMSRITSRNLQDRRILHLSEIGPC